MKTRSEINLYLVETNNKIRAMERIISEFGNKHIIVKGDEPHVPALTAFDVIRILIARKTALEWVLDY